MRSIRWFIAKKRDRQFLTQYGADSPEREDLAETALFAYGVSRFPGRIPPVDTEVIFKTVPNRIKFIETLLPPDKPIFYESVGKVVCK